MYSLLIILIGIIFCLVFSIYIFVLNIGLLIGGILYMIFFFNFIYVEYVVFLDGLYRLYIFLIVFFLYKFWISEYGNGFLVKFIIFIEEGIVFIWISFFVIDGIVLIKVIFLVDNFFRCRVFLVIIILLFIVKGINNLKMDKLKDSEVEVNIFVNFFWEYVWCV